MNYKDLDVDKMSLRIAIDVYTATKDFPKAEAFGLTSQLRRSAVSIPCNIAEGAARNSPRELIHFIGVARGSCAELLTLIEISEGIGFFAPESNLPKDVTAVAKMLTALVKSLKCKES